MGEFTVQDRIYGDVTISNPLIIELIQSKTFQRLKRIMQYGLPEEFCGRPNFTRFEHSLGVFILLKKFGASEVEQVAGLLHDVSHTAFSHTADRIFGDPTKQDHQDERHEEFIYGSDIPEILERYGYRQEEITQYHDFELLEQDVPKLCADRIDYGLREISYAEDINTAKTCVMYLTVHDGTFAFTNKKGAELFAHAFMRARKFWESSERLIRFHLLAKILKRAIAKGIIRVDDFDKDDQHVMDKIMFSKDEELEEGCAILRRSPLPVDLTIPAVSIYSKFRYIDPKYVEDGIIYTLSEVVPEYKQFLEKARQEKIHGVQFGFRDVAVPNYFLS